MTGMETRHGRSCRSHEGGRCNCEPSFRAHVWDDREQALIRRTFKSSAEAASWRRDAQVALRRGRRVPSRHTTTVRDAAAEWKRLAEAGVLRPRSGERYKPGAIRAYDQHLRMRVLPLYGDEPLADMARPDWQALVDNLLADGVAPSTIGATLSAVSAIYRFEVSRGSLSKNPARGLELPAPSGGRERFASPEEAAALLAALASEDRPIWATSLYAGLRCGELQALRACDVRLDAGVIDVHFGWDRVEGRIATKGRNRRRVPIASAPRALLAAELLRTGRRGDVLVFGATEDRLSLRKDSPAAPTRRGARLASSASRSMNAGTPSPR